MSTQRAFWCLLLAVSAVLFGQSLACAQAAPGAAAAGPDRYWVYLGSYNWGGGKGIYRSELDLKSGKLTAPELVVEANNASFLAIHPNQKWLYAINEIGDFKGNEAGGVTGYAIESSGKLRELNQESSVGPGPAHLAIDPSGKWLLVGNYGGGSSALLPIGPDGKLGAAKSFIKHEATAPQVSHAHCANFSPDGKYAFISDAGVDKIHQYKVDAERGLVPNDPPYVQIGPGTGTGPRHLTFSVDGRHAYVINETNLTITSLAYDAARGVFTPLATISTVPKDTPTKGFSTAEVAAHPGGKFVFGSNRGYDSIATFAVDPKTAELALTGQQREGIKVPRNFGIDPSGAWLLAANQDGDSVVVFGIDAETGELKPTGQSIALPKPVCVVFLAPLQ